MVPAVLSVRHRPLFAWLRALAAGIGAPLHHLVAIGHALAIIGAGVANLSAFAADMRGVMGSAGHEADRNAADLLGILQQALMLRRCVPASKVEAIVSGLSTDGGASGAIIHAGDHFARRHFVRHRGFTFATTLKPGRAHPSCPLPNLAASPVEE